MRAGPWSRVLVVGVAVVAGWESPAAAQPFEQVGVRALGMGGAFVAVADDASALYWNPAGFATGDFFGGLVEHVSGRADRDVRPTREGSGTLVALGMPALGFGYYRLAVVSVKAPAEAMDEPRRDDSTVLATRLQTSNVGASLLQSLADYVVVGTTLRATRLSVARVAAPRTTAWSDLAHRLSGADPFTETTFDADLGLMVKFRHLRFGSVVRNVRAPSVPIDTNERMTLRRHARAGVALLPSERWTLAADIDLTTGNDEPFSARRAAIGAQHILSRWPVALRAGARFALEGESRSWWSVGTSVPIRSGTWLDGQLTLGSNAADHSWGVSARVGF